MTIQEQQELMAKAINEYLENEAGGQLDPEAMIQPDEVDVDGTLPLFRRRSPRMVQVISMFEPGEKAGKRRYYYVPDRVVYLLASNKFAQAPQWLTNIAKVGAEVTEPLRKALTQTFGFAIRNPARDIVSNMITTTRGGALWIPGYNHAVGAYEYFFGKDAAQRMATEMLARGMSSHFHEQRTGVLGSFADMLTEGIEIHNWSELSRAEKAMKVPGMISAIGMKKTDIVNWFGGRQLAQMGETIGRSGAYHIARSDGFTPMYAQGKFDQADGNFIQHSPNAFIAEIYRMCMFTNAGIQMAWQLTDQFTHPDPAIRAAAWGIKAPMIAAFGGATALLAYSLIRTMYPDDEDFEKALERERQRSHWDRMRYQNIGPIKLPFEFGAAGVVQSSAHVATWDMLLDQKIDRKVFWEAAGTRLRNFPMLMQPHGLTMGELAYDYSFFYDNEIVHPALKQAFPDVPFLQAWPDTPALYRKGGELANVSPEKLRYLVRNLFTSVGDDIVSTASRAMEGESLMGDEAADWPVVGRIFPREPRGYSSRAVGDLRDMQSEYRKLGTLIKHYEKKGSDPSAITTLREQRAQLQMGHLMMRLIEDRFQDVKDAREAGDTDAAKEAEREMTKMAAAFMVNTTHQSDSPIMQKEVIPELAKRIQPMVKRLVLAQEMPVRQAGESIESYRDRYKAWEKRREEDHLFVEAFYDTPMVKQAIRGATGGPMSMQVIRNRTKSSAARKRQKRGIHAAWLRD